MENNIGTARHHDKENGQGQEKAACESAGGEEVVEDLAEGVRLGLGYPVVGEAEALAVGSAGEQGAPALVITGPVA